MEDLESLYSERKAIESSLDNFFGDGEFHSGDQGYQDLLEKLGDVQDKINEIIGYEE